MDRVHRDERNDPRAQSEDHHGAYNVLDDHDDHQRIDEMEDFLDRDIPDDVLQQQHADGYVIDAPYL